MTHKIGSARRAARALFSPAVLCLSAALAPFAPAGRAQQAAPARGATRRPELVLQTGYPAGGPSALTYSPDGRLLATTMFGSNQVKLWEVATGRELRTLAIGGGATSIFGATITGVSAVAFSRDGQLLAAGGRDNAVTVWETKTGRARRTLAPPAAATGSTTPSFLGVLALVFGADARQLVAFSDAIRTWDVETGRVLRETPLDLASLAGFAEGGTSGGGVAASADGSQIALVSEEQGNRAVKIYDLASGRVVRSVNVPDDFDNCGQTTLAVAPGARLLGACVELTGGGQRARLKLWDLTARAPARVLAEGRRDDFGPVGLSPGGRWLALGTAQEVKVYDAGGGGVHLTFALDRLPSQAGAQAFLTAFAFSADEKFLAATGLDGTVTVRELAGGRAAQTLSGHSNLAFGVAFNADGTRLVSGGRTVWDLTTGRGARAARAAEPYGVVSRDARLLAAFSLADSHVTLYDTNTQRRLFTLTPAEAAAQPATGGARRAPQFSVQPPVFSPDGRLLATTYVSDGGGQNEEPQIDAKAAEKAQKEMLKKMSKDPAAAMQAYNDALAKASGRPSDGLTGKVKLWDTQTGREARTISVPGGNSFVPTFIKSVAFSADGRTLAVTTTNSPTVTLWNAATGAPAGVVGAQPAPPSAGPFGMPGVGQVFGSGAGAGVVAFSADGRTIAVGGLERGGGFDMSAMMGQMMAAARDPKAAQAQMDALQQQMMGQMQQKSAGLLRLYDAGGGRELKSLRGHAAEVNAVAFSPDGRLLASASADNVIKLWDAGAGRELHTLAGHTATINSLAFNPEGTLLASASNDGSTLLWDARQGKQLAALVSLYDGADWLVATPDGLFDGSPRAWDQVLWRYDEDTFNVAPIEWFFNEFFTPGLLADLAAGRRPRAAQDFADKDRRQPAVTVALAEPLDAAAPVAQRSVKISIEVRDADPDAARGAGARDLRLFRNGSLVKAWRGDVLQGKPAVTLETTLALVAGPNQLTAYAFNRDNVKSRDARLQLTGADTLRRAGTAHVLAVGVNEYANPQYNLRYAVPDAREFGSEVERQQAKLGRYGRVRVTTLLDREATKANILAALARLAAETQPEDGVVVYFAGHGTAHESRFYLIPHDLGHAGSRTQLDAAAVNSIYAHSISDRELEAAFEQIGAGELMLVIDACNSGQALEAEEKRRGPMNAKGLAQLAYEKGMYVLTAAQSFQAAQEASQLGHGLLTYALVEEGLRRAAADGEPKDGQIVVREWFDYAERRVPAMQIEKVKQARAVGLDISFVEGEERALDLPRRVAQHPRVFYRRELEAQPLVVARP